MKPIDHPDVLVLLDAVEQHSGPKTAVHVREYINGSQRVMDVLIGCLAHELAGPLGPELAERAYEMEDIT